MDGEKTLEQMDSREILHWACGTILIAIGEGKFQGGVSSVIAGVMQVAYNRGLAAANRKDASKDCNDQHNLPEPVL